ncbi:MAG TPA: aspartyl protease family protein [Candidatus Elarobacter sp.]
MQYPGLWAAVIVATALPWSAASGTGDGDTAALLAKHQAYVGWHVGDGVLKTLSAVGTATRDGKVVRQFKLLRYGQAYRLTTIREQGGRTAEGFTGSVAWTTSENGFTVRVVGDAARLMYSTQAVLGELTGTGAFTPALRRHETIGGVETVVLRLASAIGLPIEVAVDPASGAYKRIVIDPEGKYEAKLDDVGYAEVGGKHFLSTWNRKDRKPTAYAYSKFELNPAIDVNALHPPSQTSSWTFGDGTAPITVASYPVPRIFVDAVVNGRKGHFILDTGADGTYIRDSFLRAAGGKKFGTVETWSLYGMENANLYRVDTIGVGPSVLHEVIVNSGYPEAWYDWEGADGLLGFDIMAATIVELNLDAKTLRIMDPAAVAPDASKGYAVPVDVSDGHIRVPMKIDDTQEALAILDTGSFDSILFARDLVTRRHVRFGGRCATFGSLTMGPIRYERPSACVTDAFAGDEMLLGMDFLSHLNYVFDYPESLVVMTPRKLP